MNITHQALALLLAGCSHQVIHDEPCPEPEPLELRDDLACEEHLACLAEQEGP